MADRVTARREAAVVDMWVRIPRDDGTSSIAAKTAPEVASEVLAAADEWDRANGYSVVRLGELRSRLLVALAVADGQNLDGFDLGHTAEVMYGPQADAVLSVLRESAERGE